MDYQCYKGDFTLSWINNLFNIYFIYYLAAWVLVVACGIMPRPESNSFHWGAQNLGHRTTKEVQLESLRNIWAHYRWTMKPREHQPKITPASNRLKPRVFCFLWFPQLIPPKAWKKKVRFYLLGESPLVFKLNMNFIKVKTYVKISFRKVHYPRSWYFYTHFLFFLTNILWCRVVHSLTDFILVTNLEVYSFASKKNLNGGIWWIHIYVSPNIVLLLYLAQPDSVVKKKPNHVFSSKWLQDHWNEHSAASLILRN